MAPEYGHLMDCNFLSVAYLIVGHAKITLINIAVLIILEHNVRIGMMCA
jgi:hypothetical protein